MAKQSTLNYWNVERAEDLPSPDQMTALLAMARDQRDDAKATFGWDLMADAFILLVDAVNMPTEGYPAERIDKVYKDRARMALRALGAKCDSEGKWTYKGRTIRV